MSSNLDTLYELKRTGFAGLPPERKLQILKQFSEPAAENDLEVPFAQFERICPDIWQCFKKEEVEDRMEELLLSNPNDSMQHRIETSRLPEEEKAFYLYKFFC